MSHTLQIALESGHEGMVVQIDFSAAFGRVKHQGIIFKLCSVGIEGSVWSILTTWCFSHIDHRTLLWTVDGVNWLTLSGKPQGSVLSPLLFFLYTGAFFHSGIYAVRVMPMT